MDSVLRNGWGASHFVTAPEERLAPLPLSDADHEFLATIGLPVGPEAALHLELRFESVDIRHAPTKVGLLSETEFEPSRFYPLTGDTEVDASARLDRFVVLGEVPNDFGPGSYVETRFVCLDCGSGKVCWVYPKPNRKGRTDCYTINSSLSAYVASLLAYKRFRDHWPELQILHEAADDSGDDTRFHALAKRIHADFLQELEAADPVEFKDGFWESHAWNEAILLEL